MCLFFYCKVRAFRLVRFSLCLCRELHAMVSLLFVLSCYVFWIAKMMKVLKIYSNTIVEVPGSLSDSFIYLFLRRPIFVGSFCWRVVGSTFYLMLFSKVFSVSLFSRVSELLFLGKDCSERAVLIVLCCLWCMLPEVMLA